MKRIFIAIFVFFLSLSAFSDKCQAEEQNNMKGFSINPFFQEINLEKDQAEATFNVEITNNTDNLAVFKLSVVDFGALDESGGIAFLGSSENLTNKYALASWIILEKDGLVVKPGEKQAVKVTMQNKESLSPGGHYAAILAKLDTGENNVENKSSEVALTPSVSSLIFARKIGGEIYGLNFKDQEIIGGTLGLPSSVRLRLQNTGNVHLTPRGLVSLTDPFGREVMRGIINGESSLVLPETFRVFPIQMQKIALAFMPGRYNLAIDYRYDGVDDFVIKKQSIFIFPAIDVWIILILVAGGYGWRQIKKKKRLEKA